jgi:hypothetical protein
MDEGHYKILVLLGVIFAASIALITDQMSGFLIGVATTIVIVRAGIDI